MRYARRAGGWGRIGRDYGHRGSLEERCERSGYQPPLRKTFPPATSKTEPVQSACPPLRVGCLCLLQVGLHIWNLINDKRGKLPSSFPLGASGCAPAAIQCLQYIKVGVMISAGGPRMLAYCMCILCTSRINARSALSVALEETAEDVPWSTSSSARQKWILTVWKVRAVAIPVIVRKVHVSGHCKKWLLRVVECNVKGGLRIENAGRELYSVTDD